MLHEETVRCLITRCSTKNDMKGSKVNVLRDGVVFPSECLNQSEGSDHGNWFTT